MAFAGINGQQIYFDDTGGDGPPVVLAHGFLMDHEMFEPQVDALRDQYRVITGDERGFGQTEYDGKPFTYWDSASDCLGLLDHLGIDRALILLDTEAGAVSAEKHEAEQGMIDMWSAVGSVDDLADGVAVDIDIASAQTLAAGLPGSDGVVQVPGAHAANLTHPEPVNAAIVQFLASLPA